MHYRIAIVMAALLGLSGCVIDLDRGAITEFEPTSSTSFKFRSDAYALAFGVNDPKSESTRLRWLEIYLKDNSMCPKGYTITSRKPVYVMNSPLGGDTYKVYYVGRCK